MSTVIRGTLAAVRHGGGTSRARPGRIIYSPERYPPSLVLEINSKLRLVPLPDGRTARSIRIPIGAWVNVRLDDNQRALAIWEDGSVPIPVIYEETHDG